MMNTLMDLDTQKRAAGVKASEYVCDGMVVGLGTGSTAKHLILTLGERVRSGLKIHGVATSRETADLATREGIPLLESDNAWSIDVAIDGADQVDPHFNLVKGGGGALLKEKIVAAAAKQFIVMVDHTKLVSSLGGSFPSPSRWCRLAGVARLGKLNRSPAGKLSCGNATAKCFIPKPAM